MKSESRKENLIRRLEENREFFHATGKMSYTSLMEEIIEYIDFTYKLPKLDPKQFKK